MSKQTLTVLLKYGLGIGLLALMVVLYWHDVRDDGKDYGLAAALERNIAWSAFVAAFALYTGGVMLTFIRWYVLVRAQDLPFDAASALRLGLIGLYWSTFLPGSVSGDIIKAAFIAREQSRRTVAVATVLLDRIIGLCGLFWLVTILGSFLNFMATDSAAANTAEVQTLLRGILLLAAGLSLGSLIFWFVLGFCSDAWSERMAQRLQRFPKVGMSLAELWRAVVMYRRRSKSVAAALGLSLLGHCGFVLTFYFSASVLSPPDEVPTLATHALIVPVGMTIQAGVPTPGGIGAELAYGYLYQLVGFTVAAGAMGSLVQRAISWILGFLGYFVYLRMQSTMAAPPVAQTTEVLNTSEV